MRKSNSAIDPDLKRDVHDPPPPQTLYAFWEYDQPPYLLGGIVERFADSGRVKVQGYGGMLFKPVAIIPDRAGKEARERILRLREKYYKSEKALKIKYKNLGLKAINKKGD
jgi:hypothetical protein